MQDTLLGIPVEAWAVGCLAIAVAYARFYPPAPRSAPRSLLQHIALRWGHSLTWLFLALAALALKYVGAGIAQVLGLLGLVSYLLFMGLLLREKMRYPTG